jgi:hypothetical protein
MSEDLSRSILAMLRMRHARILSPRAAPLMTMILLGLQMIAEAGEIDPAQIPGPTTQPISNFVRFQEDGHGGGDMQVAFARYRNDDGLQLDLMPTIHVGEPQFFRVIVKSLPDYQVVLFELVAPRGVPPTEEGVNSQQRQIARECDLDNQGPHMDYTRKMFVHADLMLEDIEKLEVAAHGPLKNPIGHGPTLGAAKSVRDTQGSRAVFNDLQMAKTAPTLERSRLMRRAYARLLTAAARPAPGETFPPGTEVLVGARNDKVMSVLDEQIAAGKRKIGILYGAAHMVDLEHRLFAHGFQRQSMAWQTAWSVAPDGSPTTQAGGNSQRQRGTPLQPDIRSPLSPRN